MRGVARAQTPSAPIELVIPQELRQQIRDGDVVEIRERQMGVAFEPSVGQHEHFRLAAVFVDDFDEAAAFRESRLVGGGSLDVVRSDEARRRDAGAARPKIARRTMVIKRVGPLSVAKVCLAMYALLGFITGVVLAVGSTIVTRMTGVEFHNPGAPIAGLDFRIVEVA